MSSQDLQIVQSNLNELINLIKDFTDQVQSQENSEILSQNKIQCQKLIDALIVKFKQGKFNKSENMNVQILKKEFDKQSKIYNDISKQLKQPKQKQYSDSVEVEMQNSTKQNGKPTYVHDDTSYEEGDSGNKEGPNMELLTEMEVHPDIQHKAMLIQEQQEEIDQIQKNAHEVLKLQTEVAKVVVEQGKQLDVAETNINQANKNVKDAVVELEGAKVEHKQYLKKLGGAACIIIIIVAVIVLCVKFI